MAGKFGPALAVLERVAALVPQDAEAQRLLGDALVARREPARATEKYLDTLKLAPDDWRAHLNLTQLLADKLPRKALEHAQSAYRLQPGQFETINNLAEALVRNDRYAEALPHFERLLKGLPSDDPLRGAVSERIDFVRKRVRSR